MRDENRIREKLELSLDSRQVVSLLIGGLVALGVVFVLGVMVGKQLPAQGKAAPHDLLASLDQTADAGPVALTFQQDLVRPSQPAPSEARAAKPVDRPTPKLDPHPAPAEKPAPTERDDDDPAPQVTKVETPKPEAVKIDPPRAEPRPAEPAPEARVEPKPTEKASEAAAPPMDQKLADAFSAAKKDPPKVAQATVPTSGFTVQVAASQQKGDADSVMQKLRSSGLRPYLVDAEIPGKGHWYRVRLGTFPSRSDAEKYVRDLKRETGFSAFVTSAR